jgi:hypothetical protein
MIEAHEVIIDILNDVRAEQDFFIIEAQDKGGYVSYSRLYSGGAYQGAFRFGLYDWPIMTIDAYGSGSQYRRKFDLTDPKSFEEIGTIIRSTINRMQTDRCRTRISLLTNRRKIEGQIYVRKKGKYV